MQMERFLFLLVFFLSYSLATEFGTTDILPFLETPPPETPVRKSKIPSKVNQESLLIKDLFAEYDSVSRPVINMSKSVEVQFGFRLLSIQLNEVDQILTSFVWLPHAWTDERLTWNPDDYDGIVTLIIPNRILWLPDTFLYESADDHGYVISYDRVPLQYNGQMEWWPSSTLRSPCTIDVTYFPFDRQECHLSIGPWGYHSEQVNYTLINGENKANLDRYSVSGAWELVETSVNRLVEKYEDLNMSYTLIDVTIKLKRKALYYWLNVIIPCLMLNCLGIGLFVLPPDSGEKVGFGLGILLTVFVFAILVNENVPKTSDYTPIIGIYLVMIMSMISLSLFLAIIIVNMHHRRPKLEPVPKWVKQLMLVKIPKVLCMKLPQLPLFTGFTMQGITPKRKKKMRMMRKLRKSQQEEEAALAQATAEQLATTDNNCNGEGNINHNGEAIRLNITEDLDASVERSQFDTSVERSQFDTSVERSQFDTSEEVEDHMTEEERERKRLGQAYKNMPFDEMDNDEWILLALVLDKLLFWCFLALLLLSSSLVLIIIPSAQ